MKINCVGCGLDITAMNNNVKVTLNRRGGRAAYMCAECARRMSGYTFENDVRVGVEKVNKFTYAFELETSYTNEKARAELYADKFVPTADCTVNVEYKTPIYRGLNAPSKQAVTIETLINNGDMRIDNECGTHVHVGEENYINPETMDYLKRFYNSLFTPLSNAMCENHADVKKVFGRDFEHWAQPITMNSCADTHENFINMQHAYTVDYIICMFKNSKQFQNTLRLCKEFTSILINNFIMHFNDEDYDRSRYNSQRDYRMHKAQITAQKLVKAYRKAVANA